AGRAELITFTNPVDNALLRAGLLYPANYDPQKKYPLVVLVYGGQLNAFSTFRYSFGWNSLFNFQKLAERGYAVLHPDSPIRNGSPLQDIVEVTRAAVDAVIEMGVADPERIGIMGQSFGGYSTLCAVSKDRRYKAAVASASFSDLISHYGMSGGPGYFENGQGSMPGPPQLFRELYLENSPLFYLQDVETPVLLTHGAEDGCVPLHAATETYVSLKRFNKTVEFITYKGEDHVNESLENVIDYRSRVTNWFDRFLLQSA